MVTEIARFRAQPGKDGALADGLARGLNVIEGAEGCLSARLCRCVEDDQVYIYQIEWETLAHHVDTFRSGPLFAQYRSHITGLFVEPVEVNHYETIQQ
jgi:heme-degrading monooxygenase HmoA